MSGDSGLGVVTAESYRRYKRRCHVGARQESCLPPHCGRSGTSCGSPQQARDESGDRNGIVEVLSGLASCATWLLALCTWRRDRCPSALNACAVPEHFTIWCGCEHGCRPRATVSTPSTLGLDLQRRGSRFCGLCGNYRESSRAHVPPQAAGNTGEVTRVVLRSMNGSISPGQPRIGGMWVRGLCRDCNSLAGASLDRAYAEFAHSVIRHLGTSSSLQQLGSAPPVPLAPGLVSRSILFGMHALNPKLRTLFPDLALGLLSGGAVRLPTGLRLRLGAYRLSKARLSGGIDSYRVLGQSESHRSFADVVFPPFAWSLTLDEPDLVTSGWCDASEWPLYGDQTRISNLRLLARDLPVVMHPLDRNPNDWFSLFASEAATILEGEVPSRALP